MSEDDTRGGARAPAPRPRLARALAVTRARLPFSPSLRRTTNNRSVRIIKGTLVAQPYATSVKPKPAVASAYGAFPRACCVEARARADARPRVAGAGAQRLGARASRPGSCRGAVAHAVPAFRPPRLAWLHATRTQTSPPRPACRASTHPHPRAAARAGNISTVLNPPNKERSSTYSACYNETSRTAQTAGTVNKRPVPYSVNSGRNRLAEADHKPKLGSSISFDMGVVNKSTHPYRTVKQATEAPTVLPMEARRGFTNPFITAEMTKRWHAAVWAQ